MSITSLRGQQQTHTPSTTGWPRAPRAYLGPFPEPREGRAALRLRLELHDLPTAEGAGPGRGHNLHLSRGVWGVGRAGDEMIWRRCGSGFPSQSVAYY